MIGPLALTPRQRGLVAALALAGGRGAGIDELADAVWAGRPPGSARSALQNQMTRLRRAHGTDLIVCEDAMYRLGRTTDTDQFEYAIASARGVPLEPTTIDSLAEAMKLWRGAPYFDLADSHTADVERARLVQERATAAELLATGRITLRDYDQCVTELRAEVADDPYRDRVWELMFVALQRAGRQAEALAAHHDYVQRLRQELGAAPTQHLIDIGHALGRAEPLEVNHGVVVARPGPTMHRPMCEHDPMSRRCRASRPRRAHRRR